MLEKQLGAAEKEASQVKLSSEKVKTLEASKMEIFTLKVSGPCNMPAFHFLALLSRKYLNLIGQRNTFSFCSKMRT
jgi:hypothetical protein